MEGISTLLQQIVHHFQSKILVFMKPSMEYDSLQVFVRTVDYLFGIGQRQDLVYLLHVSFLLNKTYFCLMASLSSCIFKALEFCIFYINKHNSKFCLSLLFGLWVYSLLLTKANEEWAI